VASFKGGRPLYLKAGTLLDFETKTSYAVTVSVADSSVAGSTPVTAEFTLTVTNVNEAPTAVSLSPTSASVAENTATATRLKMADIVVTDDALGTNATTLTGADAASFEVDAGVLYLKAGTVLDFETKTSYAVTVSVADSSVAASIPVTAEFTLTVTNVNEAPTAVSLSPTSASVAENTATATRLKMADVVVTDDALGTNAITLTGADAASFEVDTGVLYLKAGTLLDFETKTSYAVTVSVADSSVAASTPVTATFTLTVTNVVEDFTKPVLVGVAAPAARTYPSSAKLLFTATFSEPVTVAGLPMISFTGVSGGVAGKAARIATYESGAGTNQIVFSYLIAAGEAAKKGLVVAGSIQLPAGASVADLAGNTPAALTFTAPAAGSVKVDGSVPVLTKTTGPAAKKFKAGEVLSFSVTWNENVFVVGAPRLLIAVGGSPREAVYASGSGSKTVKFNYVAAAGDNGGVSLGSGAIALSGGTIRDSIGNPAGLVLKAVNLSKVAIDTTRPAVVSVALPLAGSYAKGKTATIGVTFGETLKVTSKPTLAVTVAPGVTRTFVFSKATGGTAFFTYKFAAAETVTGFTLPGAISLAGTAAIRDAVGNAAILSLPAPV
jgi:uncharacterized protein (DUF169 family)